MKDKTVKTLLFIGLVSLFGLYFLIFLKISELDRESENETLQPTVLLKHHKRQKNKGKNDTVHKKQVPPKEVFDQNNDKIVEPEEQNVTNSNSTNSTEDQEADYNFEGHSIMSKHTSFKQNTDGSKTEPSLTKFLEGKIKGEPMFKGNYPVDKMTFLSNYVNFSIISADSSFKRRVNWQSVITSSRKVANISKKEKINWTLIDIIVKENFAEQNFDDINLLTLYSIEDKYQQYKRSIVKSRSSTKCNQACLDKCKVLHGNSEEFYTCSIKECDCGGYQADQDGMKDLHNENIKNERDGVIFLIFMVVFLISVFIWKSFSSEKDEPEREEPGSEIEDYFVAKYTERMMNKDVNHR